MTHSYPWSTRVLAVVCAMGMAGAGVAACSSDNGSSPDKTKTIRVATSPGPYSEMFKNGIGPILEKDGYKLKYTNFTELQQADTAVDEGSADVNVDQHTAYMQVFNRDKHGHLISFTPIPTKPTGIYSIRHTNVDQVADGQTVGIPQDPSNLMRAMRLMVKLGWIKLKPDADPLKLTVNDVIDNKYHLKIQPTNSPTLPRALPDLDWAIIPGSDSYSSHLDPKLELKQEDLRPELILVAVTSEKNKGAKFTKDIAAAYRSDQFKKYVAAHNQNHYWFIPKELR